MFFLFRGRFDSVFFFSAAVFSFSGVDLIAFFFSAGIFPFHRGGEVEQVGWD